MLVSLGSLSLYSDCTDRVLQQSSEDPATMLSNILQGWDKFIGLGTQELEMEIFPLTPSNPPAIVLVSINLCSREKEHYQGNKVMVP